MSWPEEEERFAHNTGRTVPGCAGADEKASEKQSRCLAPRLLLRSASQTSGLIDPRPHPSPCLRESACGVCPNGGQCFQGACSYIGIPCTPGNTDCGAGNSCVYNVTSQSYVCLADIAGAQCNNVYSCYVKALGEGSHICSPANVCRPYCLQASDCASGVCEPWSYDGSISNGSPGVCKVP